jgi:hypothetical protein
MAMRQLNLLDQREWVAEKHFQGLVPKTIGSNLKRTLEAAGYMDSLTWVPFGIYRWKLPNFPVYLKCVGLWHWSKG